MLLGIPSKRGGRWAQVRDHGLPELRFRPGGLASQPACSLRPRLLNGVRASPGTLENHPGHSRVGKREDSGGKKPDSDLLIPPQRVLHVSSLLRSTARERQMEPPSKR